MSAKTLNDYCEFIVDCLHKTAPIEETETGFYSIRTPDIGRGRLIIENANRVSKETYEKWTIRAVPQAGDLILAREAPVGNIGIVPENVKVCCGQRTVHLRPDKSQIDPEYLVYLMNGDEIQGKIKGYSQGVTVAHLNMEDIRALVLPELPPMPIQRRIADIISTYDNLIENNTRRIHILEQITQALYQEWFGKVNKESLPKGWEVVTVRDVSSYINRGVSPKYDDNSSSIVVNQKCIRNEQLNIRLARRHITKVPIEKYVKFGDVLVNSTGIGTLGRVAQVYQVIHDCAVDSHVSIVRPNEKVSIDYFGFYLLTLQPVFDSLGVGSTGQTELARETIAKAEFVLPPKGLQNKFSDFVSPLRKQANILMTKNANLRQTRELLLPRLVSGQIKIN